jgi:Asp-tRNA(Asn)/Glu-tRNA(Gln) amidotransferase A subunit family amidase
MPAVTVPMGQAVESDGTIPGAGVNLEFLGRAFDEPTLLGLAYSLEQSIDARTTPALYPDLG